MHIAVVCPHCASRYQLDPSLRGKRMRCPNTLCRAVFEVQPEGERTVAPAASPQESEPAKAADSLGGMVPMLPAVAAEESPAAVTSPAPGVAPPPVRRAAPKKAPPAAPSPPIPLSSAPSPPLVRSQPSGAPEFPWDDSLAENSAVPAPAPADEPREVAAGAWQAPPVRRGAGDQAEVPFQQAVPAPIPEHAQPTRHGKRRLGVIAILLGLLLAGVAGGWFLLQGRQATGEDERFAKVMEFYKGQDFAQASAGFQELTRLFPSSRRRALYRFLAELSDVRAAVYGNSEERRADDLDRLLQFLEIYQNDALLKDRHADLWYTLARLAKDLSARAGQQQDAALLALARRAWQEAGKFQAPVEGNAADTERQLKGEFAKLEKALAERAARLEMLEALRELSQRGSALAVQEARALVQRAGLQGDPEAAKLLAEALAAHRASVKFVAAEDSPPGPPAEDNLPSFFVAPASGKSKAVPAAEQTVLALARGVLYALDPVQGDVRWVRRVGVDTAALPLRVPAAKEHPELFLVVSSDSKTLAAVEARSGAVLWQRGLRDACLAQPLLVGQRLLVPTVAGDVEEFDLDEGRRQGHYVLGQPLLVGGARQPGTDLVYFAADGFCVYALDVARRACAAVLYARHRAGALVGAPVVWNEKKLGAETSPTPGGWLLLGELADAQETTLRAYSLPIATADQQTVGPVLRVRGRAHATPWHDEDKLAFATDAGLLGLFGIRAPGNRDPLLFPWLGDSYVVASLPGPLPEPARLAHVDDANWWVWTAGRLHRLQNTFTDKAGPGLAPRWRAPVGQPLHEVQALSHEGGGATLFLTGQESNDPTCHMRAVDADTGKTLWQRQLGVVATAPAVTLGQRVFVSEPSGLFMFEPPASGKWTAGSWQQAGTLLVPRGKTTSSHTWLAPAGAQRDRMIHLAWGAGLRIQVHVFADKAETAAAPSQTLELPAAPRGTPGVSGESLLLPLADGTVARIPLTDGGKMSPGPDWRGQGVDESRPGHILALGDDAFILTDGGRGLTRLIWKDAQAWTKTAQKQLEHRIVAPPVTLAGSLAVADAANNLVLLTQDALQEKRRWIAGGAITSGPFVRGRTICCVVEHKRLLGFDPAKDMQGKEAPDWTYDFTAGIVGDPELVNGMLVVATLSGQVVALDPVSGQPLSQGYTFQANVAAAAAPVPFGPEHVFIPLVDGTAVALPLKLLRP